MPVAAYGAPQPRRTHTTLLTPHTAHATRAREIETRESCQLTVEKTADTTHVVVVCPVDVRDHDPLTSILDVVFY